jgi:hypothetical protein
MCDGRELDDCSDGSELGPLDGHEPDSTDSNSLGVELGSNDVT